MTLAPLGTTSFNQWLTLVLEELSATMHRALGANLVGLALGGGYGRGEGAVVRLAGVERPYNDIDLTLIVRRPWVPGGIVAQLRRRFTQRLGVEVDISRPHTVAAVTRWRPCLMWFDLLHGHRMLAGPADLLARHAPTAVGATVPPIEATRLLLNRGAGLLMALRQLIGHDPISDPDFIRRNYYKCALALGDAVLIAHGRYHAGRDRCVQQLRWLAAHDSAVNVLDVETPYRTAVRFKRAPDAFPQNTPGTDALWTLVDAWRRVWLHAESVRTGTPWLQIDHYVRWCGLREPERHGLARRVLYMGAHLLRGVPSTTHPREQLYRRLPLLLDRTAVNHPTWAPQGARFLRDWEWCR